MQRQITQSEVVAAATDALRADICKCMPGAVLTYDDGQETAQIQPMTNDVRQDIDTGARFSERWDPLFGVPVAWPRFGGFVIKGSALNPGDPVLLLGFDLDPTPWRKQGRSTVPVDPADVRRHGAGYWLAIPTDLTLGRKPSSPGGTLTIGAEGKAPVIIINGTTIQLGSGGGDFLALASLVHTELGKIAAAFSSFVPGSGGASFGTPYTTAGNVASALIKAQ